MFAIVKGRYSQRSANMKAVYATGTNYDDPLSMLEVGDMPKPETKPFWSTIRVKSASVNHHDVWSLQGVGLADEQTPMILGTDAAGVLQEDIPVRKGLRPAPKWCCTRSSAPMGPESCRGSVVRFFPNGTREPWPNTRRCPAPTCLPSLRISTSMRLQHWAPAGLPHILCCSRRRM